MNKHTGIFASRARTALPVLAALSLLVAASAAPAAPQKLEAGLRLAVADPTGAFGLAVEDPGFGLNGHFGVRVSPTWTLGLGLHGMVYGSQTTTHTLPLVDEFDLTTTNNLAGACLLTRVEPMPGAAVQPYAEGRLGINYLWTESKLEDNEWWSDDEVARKTNYDDFTSFWSAGGGLLVRLARGDQEQKKPGIFLDLGLRHWHGGDAEYLTEGDITIVGDQPVFSPSKSRTDMTSYEAGVTLTF